MTRKRIAIIGANGFTGRCFVDYLQQSGALQEYDPVLIDRTASDLPFASYAIDAADPDALTACLNEVCPSLIANFAGVLRGEDLDLFYRCNVGISYTAMRYAVEAPVAVEKILLIGSAAEYGYIDHSPVSETDLRRPMGPYGLSKVLQEETALYCFRRYGVPVVVARTFNLKGAGISTQLALGAWREKIAQAAQTDTLQFGNLESYRDYMEVGDVAEIYWKLLLHAPAGEVFNVCSGVAVQMRTLLEELIEASGKTITIEIDPSLYRKDDIPIIFGDNSKLTTLLDRL